MNFLNTRNFWYFCDAFTFTEKNLEVLDSLLTQYNERTGLIQSMVDCNVQNGFSIAFEHSGPQLQFVMAQYKHEESGKMLYTCYLREMKKSENLPPILVLEMLSPSLNVHQIIEIPLRYMLKGMLPLDGTHMVYLHGIGINNGEEHVYYGKTKRGWMKRFNEHVKLAMKGSNRKFPSLFGSAIRNRYDQLLGILLPKDVEPVYTGSYHVVCSAGATAKEASEAERYLIKKYSLRKNNGLNMV